MVLGLSVNGFAETGRLHAKQHLQAGRALLLTKALGTGAVLAGHMHGEAQADWVMHALAAMERSNAPAARILRAQGAEAMTDVTGFGLVGHLRLLLRNSELGAELDADALPALPGLAELVRRGRISTLQPDNERLLEAPVPDPVLRGLLCDPQTAGGLLAAVPDTQAAGALSALREAGYEAAAIIGVTRAEGGISIRQDT
jgi:selenide,water dikinase